MRVRWRIGWMALWHRLWTAEVMAGPTSLCLYQPFANLQIVCIDAVLGGHPHGARRTASNILVAAQKKNGRSRPPPQEPRGVSQGVYARYPSILRLITIEELEDHPIGYALLHFALLYCLLLTFISYSANCSHGARTASDAPP